MYCPTLNGYGEERLVPPPSTRRERLQQLRGQPVSYFHKHHRYRRESLPRALDGQGARAPRRRLAMTTSSRLGSVPAPSSSPPLSRSPLSGDTSPCDSTSDKPNDVTVNAYTPSQLFHGRPCDLLRIKDGDTFEVRVRVETYFIQLTIRLQDVDAPEITRASHLPPSVSHREVQCGEAVGHFVDGFLSLRSQLYLHLQPGMDHYRRYVGDLVYVHAGGTVALSHVVREYRLVVSAGARDRRQSFPFHCLPRNLHRWSPEEAYLRGVEAREAHFQRLEKHNGTDRTVSSSIPTQPTGQRNQQLLRRIKPCSPVGISRNPQTHQTSHPSPGHTQQRTTQMKRGKGKEKKKEKEKGKGNEVKMGKGKGSGSFSFLSMSMISKSQNHPLGIRHGKKGDVGRSWSRRRLSSQIALDQLLKVQSPLRKRLLDTRRLERFKRGTHRPSFS